MKKLLVDLLKPFFTNYFPYLVVFVASLYNLADSDLGWHLKYGEYFFKNLAILRENIFSTHMVGYQWVNSSWGTDLITYAVFINFGFLGLTILAALVITGIFYFFAKAARLTFWEKALIFPLLVYLAEPLFIVSFRGQLLTLLFLGFLYFLLSQWEIGKKNWLWLSIPLFTLWSNLHGQFILGLAIFSSWTVSYLLTAKGKFLCLVLALSFFATLINPFGASIYQESLRHFGNPLQRYIIEWLPFDKFSLLWWNLILWSIFLSVSLIIFIRKKQFVAKPHYIIPALFLCFLSFFVRRYMWSLLFISLPVVGVTFSQFKPSQKLAQVLALAVLGVTYLYLIFIKIPNENLAKMNWERYCAEYIGCSVKSAEFLKRQKLAGRMLTFYNWGGWLIWNYPEIKPSIDGRMHLWRDENGYSAFMEYYPFEQNWKDIDKSDYDIVYMTPEKPIFQRLLELVKEGKWEQAYQDQYASVFVRGKLRY